MSQEEAAKVKDNPKYGLRRQKRQRRNASALNVE